MWSETEDYDWSTPSANKEGEAIIFNNAIDETRLRGRKQVVAVTISAIVHTHMIILGCSTKGEKPQTKNT